MRKADMVRQGAEQLFVAEEAIEKALVEVAKLGQVLGQSRMDSRLSAVVGQDAFDALAVTYKRLSKARGDVVKLHGVLNDVKIQIGAGAVLVGTGNGKPPPTGQKLQLVEDDAA